MELDDVSDFMLFLVKGGKVPIDDKGASKDTVQVIIKLVNIAQQVKSNKRGWLNGYRDKVCKHEIIYRGHQAFTEKGAHRIIEIKCPRGHAYGDLRYFMKAHGAMQNSNRSDRTVVVYADEVAKLTLPSNWDAKG